MVPHIGKYFAFGTLICALNETPEEKLNFEIPMPDLSICDLIVLDPMNKH